MRSACTGRPARASARGRCSAHSARATRAHPRPRRRRRSRSRRPSRGRGPRASRFRPRSAGTRCRRARRTPIRPRTAAGSACRFPRPAIPRRRARRPSSRRRPARRRGARRAKPGSRQLRSGSWIHCPPDHTRQPGTAFAPVASTKRRNSPTVISRLETRNGRENASVTGGDSPLAGSSSGASGAEPIWNCPGGTSASSRAGGAIARRGGRRRLRHGLRGGKHEDGIASSARLIARPSPCSRGRARRESPRRRRVRRPARPRARRCGCPPRA